MKKLGQTSVGHSVSVLYEIVSNIPKSSEELEDRESLAVMAASSEAELDTEEGESYIALYTRYSYQTKLVSSSGSSLNSNSTLKHQRGLKDQRYGLYFVDTG